MLYIIYKKMPIIQSILKKKKSWYKTFQMSSQRFVHVLFTFNHLFIAYYIKIKMYHNSIFTSIINICKNRFLKDIL